MAKRTIAFNIPEIIRSMDVDSRTKKQYLIATSDAATKREIGRRLIERIVERTEKENIDKYGDKFTKYSKAYKKSLDFRIYGKTTKVTLKLTGAMLANIGVAGVDSTTVKLTFVDENQFQKASGHIDGTGANNALPVRDFWGLPLKDSQSVIKEVIKDKGTSGDDLIQALDLVGSIESVNVSRNQPPAIDISIVDLESIFGE